MRYLYVWEDFYTGNQGKMLMRYLIAMICLLIFLVACSPQGPVCAQPYIQNGQSCCLDKDANGACDEVATSAATDCSLCPPQFVTQKEQVIVYRYVCANQTVMENAKDCGTQVVSDANLFDPNTEQDAAYIRGFSVRPACRGQFTAAELHLTLAQPPSLITFQIMDDPKGSFRDVGTVEAVSDVFYYIGFCSGCSKLTDAEVPANGAYVVRAQLTYPERKVFTREYLVDATAAGEFGKKTCS
jgi:hypothetical protein